MAALAGSCDGRIEPSDVVLAPLAPLVPEGPHVRPLPMEAPVDEARAALGERLFADPRLSHDGAVACTGCHDLADGGDAGNARTALTGRAQGPINVPTVFNVRYQFRWSWTGRWDSMGDQIDAAMRAPHAMATETPDAVELIRPFYASDFDRVYPGSGLTVDTFHDAMEQYLFSLTTPDAPFDRYLRGEDGALDADARAGWEIFQTYGCVSCHQGINVGGNMFQRFGVMDDYFARDREQLPSDQGRCAITHDEADCHVFRVPSLRNVALTAPYFHDGSAPTLEDAVQVMAHFQLGRPLTELEVRSLVAFLRSLTGRQPGAHT
jgi:cytochrome c peroxidase